MATRDQLLEAGKQKLKAFQNKRAAKAAAAAAAAAVVVPATSTASATVAPIATATDTPAETAEATPVPVSPPLPPPPSAALPVALQRDQPQLSDVATVAPTLASRVATLVSEEQKTELQRVIAENAEQRKELFGLIESYDSLEADFNKTKVALQQHTALVETLRGELEMSKSTMQRMTLDYQKQLHEYKLHADNAMRLLQSDTDGRSKELARVQAAHKSDQHSFEAQLTVLKKTIEDQDKQMSTMRQDFDAKQTQLSSSWHSQEQLLRAALADRTQVEQSQSQMITRLTQEISQANNACERAQADAERMRTQLQLQRTTTEESLAALRAERDDALQRMTQASEDRRSQEKQLEDALRQVAALQAQFVALSATPEPSEGRGLAAGDLPQRLAELHENSHKAMREQERIFSARLQAMETEHTGQLSRLRTRNEQLELTMSQQMNALHASLDELVQQKRKLEDKLSAGKTQLDLLEQSLAEKTAAVTSLTAEKESLERAMAQGKDAQRLLLQQIDELNRRVETSNRRVQLSDSDFALRHEQSKRQVEMLIEENDQLKRQRDALHADRAQLESVMHTLQTTALSLQDQLRVTSAESQERLVRVSEQREDVLKRQQWVLELERKVDDHKEQLRVKEIELVRLETSVKAQRRQLDDRDHELTETARQHDIQLRTKEASIADEMTRLVELERQRQTAMNLLQEQEGRLDTFRRQLDTREAELQRERSELSRLRLAFQTDKEIWQMSGAATTMLMSSQPSAARPAATTSTTQPTTGTALASQSDYAELLSLLEKDEVELARLKGQVTALEQKNFDLLNGIMRLNQANRTLSEMLGLKTPSSSSGRIGDDSGLASDSLSKRSRHRHHRPPGKMPPVSTLSAAGSSEALDDKERLAALLRRWTYK